MIFKLCPIAKVGLVWLKVTVAVLAVVAVALIIPQELLSVEQMVIETEPLVLVVVKVTIELFIVDCMVFGLELLSIKYIPVPPLTVTGTFWPGAIEILFWLKVSC